MFQERDGSTTHVALGTSSSNAHADDVSFSVTCRLLLYTNKTTEVTDEGCIVKSSRSRVLHQQGEVYISWSGTCAEQAWYTVAAGL